MDTIAQKPANNLFDRMAVDVSKLYENRPLHIKTGSRDCKKSFTRKPLLGLYRNRLIPLKYRNYLWHLFRRTGLDLAWFNEFREYWSHVLKGRPLWGVQDLWFLKNTYRIRFQESEIAGMEDSYSFLASWQRPELIYQLLHLICKESVTNEHRLWKQIFRLKRGKIQAILEFGCGTAPVTTSLFEFYGLADMQVFISDIQTLAFHYAAYKFRHHSNVTPLLLQPENNFRLYPGLRADVIFCMTVFEHLNNPLETAKIFHQTLNNNGLLAFDYIMSDGDGMDTQAGVRERESVLDFINEKFEILYGTINRDESIGLAIARKR